MLLRADEKYGDRDRKDALEMLRSIQNEVDRNYYDPAFHGVDMNLRFKEAAGRIQTAGGYHEAMESIQWALLALDDPQTYLIPPPQPYEFDYGFSFRFYGNDCYITRVKPGSDAERQGLKAGDKLSAINGQSLVRSEIQELKISLYVIAPLTRLHLAIVSAGDGTVKEVTTRTKTHPLPVHLDSDSTRDSGFDINWRVRNFQDLYAYMRPQSSEVGDILVWKQLTFSNGWIPVWAPPPASLPPLGAKAESILEKSRDKRAMILDLRGNHGGNLGGLRWLVGKMFDHDVPICDVVSRGQSEPQIAKTAGKYAFKGKLIVLVDSETSAEAEVFARVIQIEKRGYVIGDQTSGRTRIATPFVHQGFLAGSTHIEGAMPSDTDENFGVVVSTGKVIMSDGKNLEGTGVAPDLKLLPTPADLAAGRDPVLATAISLAGHQMDPEQAGKLLPVK